MLKPYKGRELNPNKPVKVYRNVNNGLLSVMQDNLIVAHAEQIHLKSVSFQVQPSGQKKCRATKQKTVHAYASGMITDEPANYPEYNRITYNPYKNDGFTNAVGDEVKFISGLHLSCDGQMLHA